MCRNKRYQSCALASRSIEHPCAKRDQLHFPNQTEQIIRSYRPQSSTLVPIYNPRARWSRLTQQLTVRSKAFNPKIDNSMLLIHCDDRQIGAEPTMPSGYSSMFNNPIASSGSRALPRKSSPSQSVCRLWSSSSAAPRSSRRSFRSAVRFQA